MRNLLAIWCRFCVWLSGSYVPVSSRLRYREKKEDPATVQQPDSLDAITFDHTLALDRGLCPLEVIEPVSDKATETRSAKELLLEAYRLAMIPGTHTVRLSFDASGQGHLTQSDTGYAPTQGDITIEPVAYLPGRLRPVQSASVAMCKLQDTPERTKPPIAVGAKISDAARGRRAPSSNC